MKKETILIIIGVAIILLIVALISVTYHFTRVVPLNWHVEKCKLINLSETKDLNLIDNYFYYKPPRILIVLNETHVQCCFCCNKDSTKAVCKRFKDKEKNGGNNEII